MTGSARPGVTLATRLERERELNPREAAVLGAQLARALDRLHQQGGCHGAVDEDHVVLSPAGAELADGPGGGSAAADLRGLAELIYRMITGERPQTSGPGGRRRGRRSSIFSLQSRREGVPSRLDAALRRALAGGERDGYAGGRAFAQALEEAVRPGLDTEPHASRPSETLESGSWERRVRKEDRSGVSRHARFIIWMSVVLLAVAVLFVVMLRTMT